MRSPRPRRSLVLAPVIAALIWLGMAGPSAASLIGELSGTVTGGGAPLPSVWVTLTPVTAEGDPSGTPKRTLTDESGRYEFPEVYDRAVKVQVRAPLFGDLVDTYWPDVHSFDQAGIIEISSWPVTADVDLPAGVSVTGRVVDAETGAAVPDARVSAVIAAAPMSGAVGVSDRAEVPGEFALSGLPPVPMQLRVRLPAGSPYLAVGPGSSIDGVRVDGSGSTSGVTIGLLRGAEIRGTVRDDTGAAVGGALVKVVGCLPNCPLIDTSDDSGAYRMVGVSPGARLGVVAWKGDRLLRAVVPRAGRRLAGHGHRGGGRRGPRRGRLRADPRGVPDGQRLRARTPAHRSPGRSCSSSRRATPSSATSPTGPLTVPVACAWARYRPAPTRSA